MEHPTDQKKPPEFVGTPLSLREITTLLIKHNKLTEGHYELTVEFTVGFGPIGPSVEDSVPGALVGIRKLGLIRIPAETPTSVDASKVNRKKAEKSKAATRPNHQS